MKERLKIIKLISMIYHEILYIQNVKYYYKNKLQEPNLSKKFIFSN